MEDNNNKNVLDFLEDIDDNKKNSSNNKKPIIIIIIIIGLIFLLIFVKANNNFKKVEPNKTIEESKIELQNQRVNLTISEFDGSFFVEIITTLNYKNATSATFHVPKTNDNSYIYDIQMSNDNMETSTSEDENNYYFTFEGEDGRVNGVKTHKISYRYDNLINLNYTKFIFLDNAYDSFIPQFELTMKIPSSYNNDIEYVFNRKLDCNATLNSITCNTNNIEPKEQIYVTFNKKENESDGIQYKFDY